MAGILCPVQDLFTDGLIFKDMAVTNYSTACGAVAQSLIQMLANSIVGYHDIAGNLHYRLNINVFTENCTAVSDLLDCDISHIKPERLLVENVFALDECSRLLIKVFNNTDNDWTDYSECGERPLSLIEMLARIIVVYGGGGNINSIIDTAACTELTQLLDCDVNDIEAERLLVANIFAVDDCGKVLVKLVNNSSTMTDYHTSCAALPQSLLQLLARCIVLYDGHYRLNTVVVSGVCNDLYDFWTCNNGHIDPESALVENIFATDSCGNLAVKLYSNSGDEDSQ